MKEEEASKVAADEVAATEADLSAADAASAQPARDSSAGNSRESASAGFSAVAQPFEQPVQSGYREPHYGSFGQGGTQARPQVQGGSQPQAQPQPQAGPQAQPQPQPQAQPQPAVGQPIQPPAYGRPAQPQPYAGVQPQAGPQPGTQPRAGQAPTVPSGQQPPYQQPYAAPVPPAGQPPYGQAYQQPYQSPYQQPYVATKDHIAAGLLGIFLGSLGIHKFYLGYNNAGFVMLGVTILGGILTIGIAAAVMSVIALVEGILYLTKSQTEFERIYVFGRREWF